MSQVKSPRRKRSVIVLCCNCHCAMRHQGEILADDTYIGETVEDPETASSKKKQRAEAVKTFHDHFGKVDRIGPNPPAMEESQSFAWEGELLSIAKENLGILTAEEIYELARRDEKRSVTIVYPAIKQHISPKYFESILLTMMNTEYPEIDEIVEMADLGLPSDVLTKGLECALVQLSRVPFPESGNDLFQLMMNLAEEFVPATWWPTYNPHPIYDDPSNDDGSSNAGRAECCLQIFHAFMRAGAVYSEKCKELVDKGNELWNPMLYSADIRPENCYGPWHLEGIERIVETLWIIKNYPNTPSTSVPPPPMARSTAARNNSKGTVSAGGVDTTGIEMEEYSSKSFALFGETRKVKDKLMELGGKYNRHLKRKNGKEPGWIYSKKRALQVERFLKK